MTEIHPTAVVSEGAELGGDVVIGPYCVVGPHVVIGDGCRLESHVVVDGWTRLGRNCAVFPFACLGTQTQDLKFHGATTSVSIGDGTTIREYVTVNSGTNEGEVTSVGTNCHIMAYAHIAHACHVGNDVIMANCAALAGDVEVEDEAILGGMVGVHQFVRIGRLCIVGGCTKITQDCMPFMMIDGNPARVCGPNRVGLQRRGIEEKARLDLKRAYRLLCRAGLSLPKAARQVRDEIEAGPEIDHLLSFVQSSRRGLVR